MNQAGLLRLRAAQEVLGLERTWRLFEAARQDLPRARLVSLKSKYSRLLRQLNSMELHPTQSDWAEFARFSSDTAEFERELFCYAIGRLLRTQQPEEDTGSVADRLLAELAERAGVTTAPMTGLEFDPGGETLSPLIDVVRLRFPGAQVWDLPVLAHEFGHYVLRNPPAVDGSDLRALRELRGGLAAELRQRQPEGEWAGDEAGDGQCPRHAEELMADVFATYAIGPAYPQCCIALRVPRADAGVDDGTHPPWPLRIAAMIETLHRMAGLGEGDHCLRIVADDVRQLWRLAGDGPELAADEAGPDWLRQHIRDITDRLRGISGLRYEDKRLPGRIVDLFDEAGGGDLPPGSTVAHVLNAAWKWRLANGRSSPDYLRRSGDRFLYYCKQVRK